MKKKILLSIAGVAASGVILAGCGSGTTQNETTTAPVTTTAAANTETTAAGSEQCQLQQLKLIQMKVMLIT